MPIHSAQSKAQQSLPTVEAVMDDKEKASQGADLLLSLAETAREHASEGKEEKGLPADGNATMNRSSNGVGVSPISSTTQASSTEKETQPGESSAESTRRHLGHSYGWQRPYFYHPYGGMHLPYPVPHYPMPASTEEVPVSPQRIEKRVVLESIENPFPKDVKRPRLEGEERRQESSPVQSPRSTTDYQDDDQAEKGAKRESVISPSSSNETQQATDNDSHEATPQNKQTSRPSTPGFTSDRARQYPAYHGVHPHYMGYPPHPPPHAFAAPHPYGHHYGAHPPIAYPFPPPFYYRGGGMMQTSPPSYKPIHTDSQTVSPTPPKTNEKAENERKADMKGLVLAVRSDLLKSFPTSDSCPNWNQCIPLKHPLPGRRWTRDAERAQLNAMPEFSQLVNFPDYLARGRDGKACAAATGKKNCVMCGKLRVCSASTMSRRGSTGEDGEDEGAMHIIPRQNKGVCTACDVTVWAVTNAKVEDGAPVEIKWCKGCKNFRPWAAFGDKGMATKCVRCRTRQKEKYAAAKVSVNLEMPRPVEAYVR